VAAPAPPPDAITIPATIGTIGISAAIAAADNRRRPGDAPVVFVGVSVTLPWVAQR
jgi:hypothetical protein